MSFGKKLNGVWGDGLPDTKIWNVAEAVHGAVHAGGLVSQAMRCFLLRMLASRACLCVLDELYGNSVPLYL